MHVRVALAGALFLALSCSPSNRAGNRAGSAPPPWNPTPGAPPAPAAAAPSPSAPPPAAPPGVTVQFTEGPPLAFRPGPALKLKPLAKQTEFVGLSPDAKSWVLESDHKTRLFTPSHPAGVEFETSIASSIFTPDGKRVAIWGYTGRFGVLDVQSGKLLTSRDVQTCALRFASNDELVFHTASKDDDAQLFRLTISTGRLQALGPKRDAETCYASTDGTRWLVESYDNRLFVDGTTGHARPLPRESAPGMGWKGTLSTAGDRFCVGDDAGYSCTRFPDGRIEKVWTRQSSDTSVFDPSGKRAMFWWADDTDEVRDAMALVDFETLTVRKMKNIKGTSGSTFHFSNGGTLLTIGSGQGLHVYDVERGQHRIASHRPLYGNYTFPHLSRTLVAGTDEPMDFFLVDVP